MSGIGDLSKETYSTVKEANKAYLQKGGDPYADFYFIQSFMSKESWGVVFDSWD